MILNFYAATLSYFLNPVSGNKKITLFNPKSHNDYLSTGCLAFGTLSFAFPAFAASGFY